MSRLICFFSVGTQARPVTYTWDGRSHHSPYVIDAALKLDIVSRNTDQIVFAPILTKETRGQIGQDMRTAVAIAGDTWAPIEVDSTGEEAVEHVIGEMLQRVQDGDRVFVEPTNGPRPFQMALLAGALYLRALRTEVSVERLVYGEFQGGAIYDMSFVLDLFDWTRAAHAFTDALSAGPLLARLRTRRRTKLDELEVPLAGGLTPQLFTKLRGLKVPEAQGLAEREALRLVGRRLKKLKGLVDQTKEDTLNLEWLDAELVLIEEFARAGRLGDATRARAARMERERRTFRNGWHGKVEHTEGARTC